MNQIIDFTGGLNEKLDITKIADNEASIYENIDIISKCLKSLKDSKEIIDATDTQPFYFKGNWTFSKQNTSYARLLGLSYRAYDDKLEKTQDGKKWVNLWIDPPSEAPLIEKYKDFSDGDDTPYGFYGDDIQYCYTYYNENDGSESAPSNKSPQIKVGTLTEEPNSHWIKGSTTISVVASKDPQVTHINIYRIGGGIIQYSLCNQVANRTAIIIDETSSELVQGSLQTEGYIEPPKVSYITAYYALLFGVEIKQKNKLRYSDETNPLVWNELNYIIFDEDIVGLGSSSLGLLVFTEYRLYLIYGTSPSEFQRYLLYDNVGCISHKSIQAYKGSVIWQANDGIYMFNGNDVDVLTRLKLKSFNKLIISSCICDDTYYGVFEDGNIITIDFKLNTRPIMIITDNAEGIFAALNKVFITKQNKLYELTGSEEYRKLHWRSKAFSENAVTVLKNYKYIQIYVKGEFTFRCYTDDRLAAEVKLKEGYNEIKLNQELRLGYTLQFELIGKGIVLELAYSTEHRLQSKGI